MRHRLSALLLSLATAALPSTGTAQTAGEGPPQVAREFRAAWVATVANIDWPSRPGLPAAAQQTELLAILDRAAALRLNAVVFQVRPAADALYDSPHEPWSYYLTGRMGRPTEPRWDPLAFAVREAHARGLELHAWFNPYRALHPTNKGNVARTHVSRSRDGLAKRYGTHLWMDPGEPAVRAHSLRVVLDVVRRYDVDGVHIDDYFYPYKERDAAGQLIEFPDSASYARYRRSGGQLGRDDWRRHNVDRFVREMYEGVKRTKRHVKVGVSPFGIWRPGHPASVKGFDAYAELYADARKWLREGWVDYFSPQLYWASDRPEQRYDELLRWWVGENVHQRHIWPGNFTSRVIATSGQIWKSAEILEQIRLTRAQRGATGNVHFSMKAFLQSVDSLNERLVAGPYSAPALVPASRWLDSVPPPRPAAALAREAATGEAVLLLSGEVRPFLYVVHERRAAGWTTVLVPGVRRRHTLIGDGDAQVLEVRVSAVDRSGNESAARRLVPRA